MQIETDGFTVFYSPQCPYTLNSIKEITAYAAENNIKLTTICVDSLKKAKSVPCVFNNWASFSDGKFLSNTILNKNSFEKFVK